MKNVPNASTVGSLIYAIVCMWPDIELELLVSFFPIQEKNIRQQLNGISGILEVLSECVCALGMVNLCWKVSQIHIWLVTWTPKSLHRDT